MPTKRPVAKKKKVAPDALASIATCFGLDELEHAVLGALVDAELSVDAWHALQKRGGVNARSIGALVGDVAAVITRLGPEGALRRHALVRVDAPQRLVGADDALRLEVGLAPRHVYLPAGVVRHAPGVRVPSDLAKRLDGTVPQVVLLDAPPTQMSAQSVADGLQRPVYAGSVRGAARDVIARLRRDADLEGAALWLLADEAALDALLVPPRSDALVVLAETAHVEARAPWRVRREKMGTEPSIAPAAPRNELDYVRMLAQRDADAALGIVRAAAPAARPMVPGRIVDASVRVAEQAAPPVVASPAPEVVPAPKAEAAPVVAPAPVAAPIAGAAPAPAPVVEVAHVEQSPGAPQVPAEPDGPRMDIPADAPSEVRARASIQSPSAQQRIELMESLAGAKTAAVVAAVRHNAKSEHAGVRAMAERLMAQIFGPNWNRSRAITPPVQPPPSPDDKP